MADAIIKAVPRVILQFLVMSLVLFVFSAVGVNLFGGRFGYCADAAGARLAVEGVNDKAACAESGYEWVLPRPNFDTTLQALGALWPVLFIDGWVPIMYMSLDVRGIDEQPSTETTLWPVLYYLIFIMVGTLFFMNLIIGGIVGTFEELFRESKGIHVLTEEQERWVSAQQVMQRLRFYPPNEPVAAGGRCCGGPLVAKIRFFFFRLVTPTPPRVDAEDADEDGKVTAAEHKKWVEDHSYHGRAFGHVVSAMIVLNICMLMFYTPAVSDEISTTFAIANAAFNSFFFVEAGVKLLGLGFRQYWRDLWNRYDLLLVLASMASGLGTTITRFTGYATPPLNLGFLRALRVLRLGKSIRSFRLLLLTLVFAAPAFFNILFMMYIVMYVFAMVGMVLMGGITPVGDCRVSQHANFDSIWIAMETLFRFATGDGWSCFYLDAVTAVEESRYPEGVSVPFSQWVHVYFVLYMSLMLLIVSVFVAIIIRYYNLQSQMLVSSTDIQNFARLWVFFDRRTTNYIRVEKVGALLLQAAPPLVSVRVELVGRDDTRPLEQQNLGAYLAGLRVPVRGGKVHFLELLTALADTLAGCRLPPEAKKVQASLLTGWPMMMPSLLAMPPAEGMICDYARRILNHTHTLGYDCLPDGALPEPGGMRPGAPAALAAKGGTLPKISEATGTPEKDDLSELKALSRKVEAKRVEEAKKARNELALLPLRYDEELAELRLKSTEYKRRVELELASRGEEGAFDGGY